MLLVGASPGKNKRVGKQLASQKILQMLHPHVKNWGSLLRMYGRESNKMVKKVTTSARPTTDHTGQARGGGTRLDENPDEIGHSVHVSAVNRRRDLGVVWCP